MLDLGFEFTDAGGQVATVVVVHGEPDAAGSHQAFAEAVAAKEQGHVEKISAHAAAIIGRRQKGHIAAQGAQVAHMVGDALQFQADGADDLGPGIHRYAAKGLHGLGMAQAVADRGVTGSVFGDERQPFGHRPTTAGLQRPGAGIPIGFPDAAPFTDAVEPEMARFDHSGMHRSHSHFVDLIPSTA
jgi:hypothetical protein